MRLYFSYGFNMNAVHMREICPAAQPIGVSRLPEHRFAIMSNGWATVLEDPTSVVWGVLWDITPACEHALDVFEEVENGLYAKKTVRVSSPWGWTQTILYKGCVSEEGRPHPGYMETIAEWAANRAFPQDYCLSLEQLILRDV